MKNANPALVAMFATDQDFEQFDLYTITLQSGFVVRYATCPFDVVYGGNIWLCSRSVGGVVIDEEGDTGPRAHWTADLNTGTWAVTVMPRDTDVIGNIAWAPAVEAGIFDEAIVTVDRGYVAAWPSIPTLTLVPVGTVNVFTGRVAEIDFGRSAVQINMNDPRELLATNMPRNLFGASCDYAMFSPQCTLNKAAFGVATTIIELTAALQVFYTGAAANPDGYFALGDCLFTSGANAGLRLMVRSSGTGSGLITLICPMPFALNVGDALTLYPGCDKTTTTCNDFSNILNYGGFPLIPQPETAV